MRPTFTLASQEALDAVRRIVDIYAHAAEEARRLHEEASSPEALAEQLETLRREGLAEAVPLWNWLGEQCGLTPEEAEGYCIDAQNLANGSVLFEPKPLVFAAFFDDSDPESGEEVH